MKNILFTILSLIIVQNSFAGDAGYTSVTCISKSQRTILTSLNDYTENASIYTLVLDGVPAIYSLKDNSVTVTGNDGVLIVSKDGTPAFKSTFNAKKTKMNLEVYKDPRINTIAEHGSTPTPIKVVLQCKEYWPNP